MAAERSGSGRSPRLRRASALAAIALLASLLVACGGGSSSSTTAGTQLSTDAYEQQVQQITAAFANGFGDLSKQAANPKSAQDFQNTVVAIQDRIGETVDALKALDPPPDLAQVNAELVQVFTDYRDGYDPIVSALKSGDSQALKDAAKQIPTVVKNFQTDYQKIQQEAADAGVTIEAAPSS